MSLISYGLSWLEVSEHFQLKGWRHVYLFLLGCQSCTSEHRKRLMQIGIAWLEEEGEEQYDHWHDVFISLLDQKDCCDDLQQSFVEIGLRVLVVPQCMKGG